MDKNPRIAEIEERQEKLRKKAEEMREKGDLISYNLLQGISRSFEGDKLFVMSPKLLEIYREILRKTEIEVNGMKWPIGLLIDSTGNSCWQRSDIELGQVFVRDGEKFRVIGIADEPTVIVEHIETGKQEHHVISSRNFSEFRKIESEGASG